MASNHAMERRGTRYQLPLRTSKKAPGPTFADLADRWLQDWSRSQLASHGSNLSRLRCHILPLLGAAAIGEITEYRLERFSAELLARGLHPKTVNNCLALVSAVLGRSARWSLIPKDHARPTLLRVPDPEWAFFSREELRRLLGTAQPPYRDIFAMLYLTGLRLGNCLGLQRDDVFLDLKALRVRISKSGRMNWIQLTAPARRIVERHLPLAQPWLFPNQRTGAPYVDLKRPWTRALKAAGFTKRYRIHDLRHTRATHMRMAGFELAEIQTFLGHSSLRMTMRYAHVPDEWIRRKLETLDMGL